jgi:hypothetical protein
MQAWYFDPVADQTRERSIAGVAEVETLLAELTGPATAAGAGSGRGVSASPAA